MKDLVIMHDQQAVTTSLILAEAFEKQHKHVIEAIEKKISTAENSALLKNMFVEDSYIAKIRSDCDGCSITSEHQSRLFK